MDYFLHSLKKVSSIDELEVYFDSAGVVRMPPDYVKDIISNPLLHIYHKLFFRKPYRAVPNHNLAESIFNIAFAEYSKNKKNAKAKAIAYKAASFCVTSLQPDGKYNHNEHNHEDQFPLHGVAVNTLINAYNLFKEKKFLDAAINATDYLLKSRFEERVGSKVYFWFPHDTLELESRKNQYVLNTHMYTIAVLCMMYQYTKNKSYFSAAKNGVEYFKLLIKKYPERRKFRFFTRYLIGRPKLLGVLPSPLATRDFFSMTKTPSFQTGSGFLKRALYQPGPHYHFANLLNMELVNQYISLDLKSLNDAWNYGFYLLANGFKNKLYIHSDWYSHAGLMLAIRRKPSLKKYLYLLPSTIGDDPRTHCSLEPSTHKLSTD